MNVQEKQAWFTLAVFAVTLILYGVLVSVVGFKLYATGAFGFCGLAGFAPLIGRKEWKAGKVVMDERDEEILKSALIAGYSAFWFVFVTVLVAPLFILGPEEVVTIPVPALSTSVCLAFIITFSVRALVTVILYRWRAHDGQE